MKFEDWKTSLLVHDQKVRLAQKELDDAEANRDRFLKETVGFESRSMATLVGTAEMISKIIDMKKDAT